MTAGSSRSSRAWVRSHVARVSRSPDAGVSGMGLLPDRGGDAIVLPDPAVAVGLIRAPAAGTFDGLGAGLDEPDEVCVEVEPDEERHQGVGLDGVALGDAA